MIGTETKFEILIPEPNVYHVVFDNQRDLAMSMMRLQEYYEGPCDEIRGNYFTLEQFMHYFTDRCGEFGYTHQWSGFNVPGHIVEEWLELFTQFAPLLSKEQQMHAAVSALRAGSTSKWYLIATTGKLDSRTVKHEIAHARYYLSEDYRAACDQLMVDITPGDLNMLTDTLLRMGYNPVVITDEIQAYLGTSSRGELDIWFDAMSSSTKTVSRKLRKLFKEHRA
jgi:hypothetical protein